MSHVKRSLFPPGTGGGGRDLAAPLRTEGGRARQAAAPRAKLREGGRVRIARDWLDAPREDVDPLGRGAAACAGGADDVGVLRFGDLLLPIADEAAAPDVEDDPFASGAAGVRHGAKFSHTHRFPTDDAGGTGRGVRGLANPTLRSRADPYAYTSKHYACTSKHTWPEI